MNSDQFERQLRRQGIKIFAQRSGSGHKDLFNPENGRWSELPVHGGRKQLGKGLMRKILRDLGLR
jgi:mRNA interferase HicA